MGRPRGTGPRQQHELPEFEGAPILWAGREGFRKSDGVGPRSGSLHVRSPRLAGSCPALASRWLGAVGCVLGEDRSPSLQEAAPSSPGGRRAAPAPNSHPSAHVTVHPAPLLKHPIIFRIKLQQGVGAETGELGTEGTIKLPVGF